MIPVRDYLHESRLINNRIVIIMIIIVVMTLILLSRLLYLQLTEYDRFTLLAQNNRINISPLPPVRGLIYDRNGEVLAQNLRVYNLEILPDKVDDMDELLNQLGQLVTLSESDLTRFRKLLSRRPSFERQTLRANLNEEEAARLAVNQHKFKGAELRARLQRHYPRKDTTGHVVGYVGRISPDDLERIDKKAYSGMEYIGKSGVEAYYETTLLGQAGFERVETNAHGRIVKSLEHVSPDTGKTLHLSLDVKLQELSMEILKDYEGSVVAIEPKTGEVLAFASVPGYDPNPFVNGISDAAYSALRTSDRRPLLNRALNGRYAPGSTIKGFVSLVGMDNGVNPSTPSFCPGYYSLPGHSHRYRCWKKAGHGSMTAYDAIVQSCDVYFYRLAKLLGIDKLYAGMTQFGFGVQTGIDLLGEPSGLMPSSEWKKEVRGEPWYPGETVIAGIGQGYMLVTPLQLASSIATLANRGVRVIPRFLSAIENPQSQTITRLSPRYVEGELGTSPQSFEYVIDSMKDVVHGPKGTARRIGADIEYEMAGKTGTAQVKSIAQNETYDEENTPKQFKDHSLFVGFAPLDDPKIAIAVIIEHGGSGSRTAAPIARKLLDFYLLEQLKIKQVEDVAEST